jgi:hypothetical protein
MVERIPQPTEVNLATLQGFAGSLKAKADGTRLPLLDDEVDMIIKARLRAEDLATMSSSETSYLTDEHSK